VECRCAASVAAIGSLMRSPRSGPFRWGYCSDGAQTDMRANPITRYMRNVLAVTVVLGIAGLSSSCGTSTEITWSSQAVSPDGNWTATAMTEGTSGPGNNYLGTTVYLKRTNARSRGYEVLGYPEDTSTWARGKAVLALRWRDRSTLQITFKQIPKLQLQVCKYGDIDISVQAAP
jgi:hypothetical protein